MASYPLVYYPDKRLMTPSPPVNFAEIGSARFQTLIDDMFTTMYAARGVGLAAPQIGINEQLAVVDVGGNTAPLCLINPVIIASHGKEKMHEGCLSLPGAYEHVERASKVTVKAYDRMGIPFELTASDLLGECIQHEVDHLLGKLFIHLLSDLKRDRVIQRIKIVT
jgi:peptide deformylase